MQQIAPPPTRDTGKPRRTEPKQVRRRQLIEATIDSIAQYGIAGTTMSTVTEIAGLSLGLANFHFQSKQNLLEETLKFLAREHHDHWRRAYGDAGLSARDKLMAIVDSHFDPKICTQRKLAVWYAYFGEGGRRTVYRALVDALDNERFDLSNASAAISRARPGIPARQPIPSRTRWRGSTMGSGSISSCIPTLLIAMRPAPRCRPIWPWPFPGISTCRRMRPLINQPEQSVANEPGPKP